MAGDQVIHKLSNGIEITETIVHESDTFYIPEKLSVEEAAKVKYIGEFGGNSNITQRLRDAFIAGANWQLNNQ